MPRSLIGHAICTPLIWENLFSSSSWFGYDFFRCNFFHKPLGKRHVRLQSILIICPGHVRFKLISFKRHCYFIFGRQWTNDIMIMNNRHPIMFWMPPPVHEARRSLIKHLYKKTFLNLWRTHTSNDPCNTMVWNMVLQ